MVMNRNIFIIVLAVALIALLAVTKSYFPALFTIFGGPAQPLRVGLVCSAEKEAAREIKVYAQILREMGIPVDIINPEELLRWGPEQIARYFTSLIIPEQEATGPLPPEAREKLAEVIPSTNCIIVYDMILKFPADITGVSVSPPIAPFVGPWIIPNGSELQPAFDQALLTGDRLKYPEYPPVATWHLPAAAKKGVETLAVTQIETGYQVVAQSGASPEKKFYPLITRYTSPAGKKVIFINSPLAYLKYNANDDAVVKNVLRHFLISNFRSPYIIPAPQGIGGFVFNLHLCAQRPLLQAAYMYSRRKFSPEIPMSISVTAGPDRLSPGDGQGVDALGRGKDTLRELASFGSISSHGGWRHDYWGFKFNSIPPQEKTELLKLNFDALQELTGQPVIGYAAPAGQHSPEVHRYLVGLGVRCMVYPAAFNSPPTHPWVAGALDGETWLFPYSATRFGTCMENAMLSRVPPLEMQREIQKIIDTAAERREIRLFYSHPAALVAYPDVWDHILAYLKQKKNNGSLTVRPMEEYVEFLDRHEKTELKVYRRLHGYSVFLSNPVSLQDIAVALPVDNEEPSVKPVRGVTVRKCPGWIIAVVNTPAKKIHLTVRW